MTPSTSAKVRLFAALVLPPEVTARLQGVIRDLRSAVPPRSVRWVRADGIHLTLKFYGEVASETFARLPASLRPAAASVPPISLALEGLSVFPNPMRPRVIWMGVGGEVDRLRALQQAVEQASGLLGFKPEMRGYTPHLTLGRVPEDLKPAERQKLARVLKATKLGALGAFTAETLSLLRSELKPTGAVYTSEFEIRLSGRKE